MSSRLRDALAKRAALAELGLDIYAPLTEHPEVVYTLAELEALLRHKLVGRVFDAPQKTRGKLAKQAVAATLGYPVPPALRNTKPRFPGQDLDVYVQQSNNLQIYNHAVNPTRRYAVLGVDAANQVRRVRVLEGSVLALFDTTGTLTSKYQAKRRPGNSGSVLVSPCDTPEFMAEFAPVNHLAGRVLSRLLPSSAPTAGLVLSVAAMHKRLKGLIGQAMAYSPNERNRGEQLHRAVCSVLGLGSYADTGRFPDIVCQALEVKCQLAGTIDLGLVSPSSQEPALTLSPRLRHCDARYLVAYAVRDGDVFLVEHVVTTTGAAFFEEFRAFGGLGQNKKLQLRLPKGFLDPE